MKKFDFEKFIEPYVKYQGLEKGSSRYLLYEYIMNKLTALNKPLHIIETGTMWIEVEKNMGAFTLIFADLIKNWTGGKLTTIDISEDAINKCKESTKEYADVIKYVTSDSVSYLKSLSDETIKNIDLFYFDSYDLNLIDPIPSQLHHYRELAAVYDRLSYDVIITIDDNFLPDTWVQWVDYFNGEIINEQVINIGKRVLGKGTLIDCFLLQEKWKKYEKHFQIGTENVFLYERY